MPHGVQSELWIATCDCVLSNSFHLILTFLPGRFFTLKTGFCLLGEWVRCCGVQRLHWVKAAQAFTTFYFLCKVTTCVTFLWNILWKWIISLAGSKIWKLVADFSSEHDKRICWGLVVSFLAEIHVMMETFIMRWKVCMTTQPYGSQQTMGKYFWGRKTLPKSRIVSSLNICLHWETIGQ